MIFSNKVGLLEVGWVYSWILPRPQSPRPHGDGTPRQHKVSYLNGELHLMVFLISLRDDDVGELADEVHVLRHELCVAVVDLVVRDELILLGFQVVVGESRVDLVDDVEMERAKVTQRHRRERHRLRLHLDRHLRRRSTTRQTRVR